MVGREIGSRCWSRSDIVAARLLPMVGGKIVGRCQRRLGRGRCIFIGHIDIFLGIFLFHDWTW
jgi:hypothetical protein